MIILYINIIYILFYIIKFKSVLTHMIYITNNNVILLIHPCDFIYVYATDVFVFICLKKYTWRWQPERNTGCLPLICSLLFFERGSLIELGSFSYDLSSVTDIYLQGIFFLSFPVIGSEENKKLCDILQEW